jgi:membrane fusion protein (multidrug efflux system)
VRWLPLLLAAACGGDSSGSEEKGTGPAAEAPPEPVTVVDVAEVTRGGVADTIGASAIVESEAQADLVPEAVGIVVEVRADEGDHVEAGTVLAVLDNVMLDTGALRAKEEVARLESQVQQARALSASGAISDKELEDLEFQLRTAQLSAAEATKTFGQTRITAPFAGVIAARNVSVGELATSATPAFQLVDPTRLRVVASLPERDLGRVEVGQPARLTSAYDDTHWASGHVVRIAPVVDPQSGTFRVTVGLDELGELRPGQFVSIRLEVDRHEDVLVVPKDAVVWEDGTPVVYRVVPWKDEAPAEGETKAATGGGWFAWWPFGGADEDDEDDAKPEDSGPKLAAARTSIALGLVDDQRAEITEGVAMGDSVITVGQSHLRDGARVRPSGTTAEAARAEAGKDPG